MLFKNCKRKLQNNITYKLKKQKKKVHKIIQKQRIHKISFISNKYIYYYCFTKFNWSLEERLTLDKFNLLFTLHTKDSAAITNLEKTTLFNILKKKNKLKQKNYFLKLYPIYYLTSKPTHSRMGKGKGLITGKYLCLLSKGSTLLEFFIQQKIFILKYKNFLKKIKNILSISVVLNISTSIWYNKSLC